MTATPKHRLRATVTYTIEMPLLMGDELGRGEAALVRADLKDGSMYLEDCGEPARTVKVEVIR